MDPAPPQANPPNSLDYGPRPRLHQRQLLRRIVIAAILITAIAFSVQQIRSHWPELHLYYLEHECLAHPTPPGIQLYSSANPAATHKSPEFDAFFHELLPKYLMLKIAKRVPIYLGTRQATDGTKRFLAIFAAASVSHYNNTDAFDDRLLLINLPTGIAPLPKNWQLDYLDWTGWRWEPNALSRRYFVPPHAIPDILINSGVEDPNDPSHVTFTLDVNDAHYIYDLYVQPGGSILIRKDGLRWTIAHDGSRSGPTPTPQKFDPTIIYPP